MKKSNRYWCIFLFLCFLTPGVTPAISLNCQTSVASGQPTSLAYDPIHSFYWVTYHTLNNVQVFGTDCSLVATITVGTAPEGIAFDSNKLTMYVANTGSNNVTVIDVATFLAVKTLSVGSTPRGVTFDGYQYMYVANYGSNTLSQIDTVTATVTQTFTVGTGPYYPKVDPNGLIWVPNRDSNNVTIINLSTHTQTNIATDTQPQFIASDPAGGNMFVSCYNSSKIDQFSTVTHALIRKINAPHANPMAIDASTGIAWGVTWSGYLYSINPSTGVVGNVTSIGGNNWDIQVGPGSYIYETAISVGRTRKYQYP